MSEPFPQMPLPHDLTYEFLGTFARFEYALKDSGFANGNEIDVKANWDKFAEAIDTAFENINDQVFKDAVNFLLTTPPRKQVLLNGRIDWKVSPPDGHLPIAQQVLTMVRRIRNNLFHGAKIWSPDYDNRERDVNLVKAGLLILRQCALLNEQVRAAFGIGVF